MSSSILVSLSLQNVWRHGRRSLNTILIMIVSVLTLDVLFGYVEANLDLTKNAFMRWGARGHLIIERPTSALARVFEGVGENPIDAKMQRRIADILAKDPSTSVVARILRVSGLVSNSQVTTIFGGFGEDVEETRRMKGRAYEYDVVAGKPLWQTSQKDAVVLGQGLAGILGCEVPPAGFSPLRPGETPTQRPFTCPAEPLQLSVVTQGTGHVNASYNRPTGVMDWGLKEVNDRLVVLSLPAAQRLLDTDDVSEYHVLLDSDASMGDAERRIGVALRSAGLDAQVFRWSDRASFYKQVRGVLLSFFGFMLAVAVVVGFTSLLNSSYMNFMRRRRELATLRSLGYTRGFVVALAALENAWLALAAAVLGTIAAGVATAGVRAAGWTWIPPGSSNPVPVTVEWVVPIYVATLVGVVVLAILSSMIPTYRILAMPIRAALADA
jgi:putative ABC transport system permease protein